MEISSVGAHPQKVICTVIEQEWVLDSCVDFSLANVLLAHSGREGINMLDLIAPKNDLLDDLDGVESEAQNQIAHLADELSG